MQVITVSSGAYTRLVSAASGEGSVLIQNSSATVTVSLTDNQVGTPGTSDAIPLGPAQSVTVDGSRDVYAFTTGAPADIYLIFGGQNFFQPAIIDGTPIVSPLLLFYFPSPGAGNLIESIAEASGTDKYGNHYIGGGHATYDGTIGVLVSGFQVSGISGSLAAGWILDPTLPSVDMHGRTISTSPTGTLSTATITTSSPSGDITVIAPLLATAGTSGLPTRISTDVPQAAALAGLWAGAGTLQYMLMPDVTLSLEGILVVPAGIGNPSTIAVLPGAPYVPVTTRPLICVQNAGPPFLGIAVVGELLANGVIRVYDATPGDTLRISSRPNLAY